MKTTKILSLILVLSMVLSVLAIGIVSVYAAEGETPAEVAADATELVDGGAPVDGTEAPTEPATEASTETVTNSNVDSSAKWSGMVAVSDSCDESSILRAVLKNLTNDYVYLPIHVIATQTQSGTNYAFLTNFTANTKKIEADTKNMTDEEKEDYYRFVANWQEIITVHVDTAGNTTLVKRVKIDPADIKTLEKESNEGNGWDIKVTKPKGKMFRSDYSEAAEEAVKSYKGLDLSMIYKIGTQKVSDSIKNYRFLCYGTKDSKTNLYVVEVHEEDGKAEIVKVSLFDLAAYVASSSEIEKSTENNTNANTQKNSGNTGNNTSSKSPQTGHSDLVLMMLLIVLVGAGGVFVSVKQISKKKD